MHIILIVQNKIVQLSPKKKIKKVIYAIFTKNGSFRMFLFSNIDKELSNAYMFFNYDNLSIENSWIQAISYLMKFWDYITNIQFWILPWCNLIIWLLKIKTFNNKNSIGNDAWDTITIEINKIIFIKIIHNFKFRYQNRHNCTNNIFVHEVSNRFHKVPNLQCYSF